MNRNALVVIAVVLMVSVVVLAQITSDPFPTPIAATEGVIPVKFTEFAAIPNFNNAPPRIMTMLYEPGTQRYFASDMNGKLYVISSDGKTVTQYLDLTAADWSVGVQAQGSERGFQSFAFHPQFNQRGARGFGKFYTVVDSTNTTVPADFKPSGGNHTHDTLLLEWTAKDPAVAAYDGAAPREVIRLEQPFANHNAGHLSFNPLARNGDADYGLLYMGFADGGSGGDPLGHAQNLTSAFGKIHRLNPLGNNSANKKYGIPASNPFANDGKDDTLGEIYAYGVRNPQRLFWDPKNGNMFMSDIGQDTVEKVSAVTAGANLGWNVWEGSFRFTRGGRGSQVNVEGPRGDSKVTYPIAEYGQQDPLLMNSSAAIGGLVYRSNKIPQLTNLLIFGDNPSGEMFYVNADNLPKGGQDSIRRILLNDAGTSKKFLEVIREKNATQGRQPANRADLRFAEGPDGQIFLLNKRDGTIRMLVAG
jgi:Glucose / Sorbosone dehydrogenase